MISAAIGLVAAAAAQAQEARVRVCLNAAQAREAIVAHHLADPVAVMKNAAQQSRSEALAAKLCQWNDAFVYEITLLGRDGRVTHAFTGASDGKAVSARDFR